MVELNQNFRRSLLSYNDKAKIMKGKKSPGWQKVGTLLPRDGIYHPMATDYGLRATGQIVLTSMGLTSRTKAQNQWITVIPVKNAFQSI